MTPLLFKSLAAWLNNSKDKGFSVFESRWRGVSVDVEGLSVAT